MTATRKPAERKMTATRKPAKREATVPRDRRVARRKKTKARVRYGTTALRAVVP